MYVMVVYVVFEWCVHIHGVMQFTCQHFSLLQLTPCNLMGGYQYFGGMWLLYLPLRWRQQFLLKCWYPSTEVHSLVSYPLVWESRTMQLTCVLEQVAMSLSRSLRTKFWYEMIKFILQSLLHIVCATVWLTCIFTVLEYLKAFFCDGTGGVVVRL